MVPVELIDISASSGAVATTAGDLFLHVEKEKEKFTVQVTVKLVCFHYLTKYFLDLSIQKISYMRWKTEALSASHVSLHLHNGRVLPSQKEWTGQGGFLNVFFAFTIAFQTLCVWQWQQVFAHCHAPHCAGSCADVAKPF